MRRVLLLGLAMAWSATPLLADGPQERLSDVPNAQVAPPVQSSLSTDQGRSGPTVTAGLTWFTNQGDFEAAAGEQICLEDFEEGQLPPGRVLGIPDPLCSGVEAPMYPNGLEGCESMCLQSNLGAGNPENPDPRGANGIALASAGFLGAVSDIAIINTFVDSGDFILDREDVGAVGGNTLDALGDQGGVDIRVYGIDNALLGQEHFAANIQGTNFMGVISDDPIGRINVYSTGASGAEGLDNVTLWFGGPAPTGACCLGDASCVADVTNAECRDQGGIAWTKDAACEDVNCAGACCKTDGSCLEAVSKDDCDAAEGVFNIDTTCEDANCPQPGACCLPGDTCEDGVLEQDCLDRGGLKWVEGDTCDNVECPTVIRYSEDFVQGQPSPDQCTVWNAFRDQLVEMEYSSVTMKGSNDPVGITCDDPEIVKQIALAMNTNSAGVWECNGRTFRTGACGPGLELSGQNGICACTNPAFTVRPCIGNGNWGGINTATCGGPNQTMTVEFAFGPPQPTACCLPDQSCEIILPDDCEAQNGRVSFGKTCEEVDCSGACCLPDKSCEILSQSTCEDREGRWTAGAACEDVNCNIGSIVVGGNQHGNISGALQALGLDFTEFGPGDPPPGEADIIFIGRDGGQPLGFDYREWLAGGGDLIVAGGSGLQAYRDDINARYFNTDPNFQWHTDGNWNSVGDHPANAGLPNPYTFQNVGHTFHMMHFLDDTPDTVVYGANDEPNNVAVFREYDNGGSFNYMALDLGPRPQDEDAFITPWVAAAVNAASVSAKTCNYRLKKVRAKRGCEACPSVGDNLPTEAPCETVGDCDKKIKTKILCPDGGRGKCKLKGKRSSCQ